MIPHKVRFSGLEIDPENLTDRWHRGVVPLDWSRYRFFVAPTIQNPVSLINRWMQLNIEGRWSIWIRYINRNLREANLAFEHDHDGVTFVLADAKNAAFKDAEPKVF